MGVQNELSSMHRATAIRAVSGSSASSEVRVHECLHAERRFLALVLQQDARVTSHGVPCF